MPATPTNKRTGALINICNLSWIPQRCKLHASLQMSPVRKALAKMPLRSNAYWWEIGFVHYGRNVHEETSGVNEGTAFAFWSTAGG